MFNKLSRNIKGLAGYVDERLSAFRQRTTEQGRRGTELSQQRQLYSYNMPDFELAAVISDIRKMDRMGGEIKRIHNKVSGSLTKGGILMDNPKSDAELARLWKGFTERTQLNKRLKLMSDARGLIVTGSLPLQWVLDDKKTQVVRCIQMPTETIRPIVGVDGQFTDPKKAFAQYSAIDGKDLAYFARWQLDIARLDPDNYDDMGALGRPMLDAIRKKWRQVDRSSDDMVIRRGTRAPMRTSHMLDGATKDQLAEYKQQVESEEGDLTSNYYSNKKGAVQAVQGDENLDQIADVTLLLDAMFAGTPMPKGLLGYVDGLSRDVLQDMKTDLYEELDTLQDSLSEVYSFGFRLELLLNGINPDDKAFTIRFGERLTETLTQKTDRALKIMALGASRQTAWRTAGLDHEDELERLEDERANADAYPMIDGIPGIDEELESASDRPIKGQRISITPNQGGGNDSATDINN